MIVLLQEKEEGKDEDERFREIVKDPEESSDGLMEKESEFIDWM